MTDARFCSHTARAGERLSSAGCFSLVLTASSLPDSGSQATVAAPPYCEGPETDGFRAEVEENGILGFEDIEGAKGEEGAWEGWVGKEVGPGGLAAKGVGEKEGEGDRRAEGGAPPMLVSRGGEEVEAEDLGWQGDKELVWAKRGEEAVRETGRRGGGRGHGRSRGGNLDGVADGLRFEIVEAQNLSAGYRHGRHALAAA